MSAHYKSRTSGPVTVVTQPAPQAPGSSATDQSKPAILQKRDHKPLRSSGLTGDDDGFSWRPTSESERKGFGVFAGILIASGVIGLSMPFLKRLPFIHNRQAVESLQVPVTVGGIILIVAGLFWLREVICFHRLHDKRQEREVSRSIARQRRDADKLQQAKANRHAPKQSTVSRLKRVVFRLKPIWLVLKWIGIVLAFCVWLCLLAVPRFILRRFRFVFRLIRLIIFIGAEIVFSLRRQPPSQQPSVGYAPVIWVQKG